jgi:penicillin-binding protein 2
MEKAMLPGGTAAMSMISGIAVCGKTGTAQNPHGDPHSAFIAFAPKELPKIAIAVYIENGNAGATYAEPIANLMIEKYLNDSIAPGRKVLEKKMTDANLLKTKQIF